MKKQILLSLSLSLSLAIGAFGEARVELNDGWLFTLEEPIASLRMFSIPSMLDMLDGQRRDLIETPRASRKLTGLEPGEGLACLKPDFKPKGWEPARVPHDAAIAYSFAYDLAPFDGYLPGTGVAWYRYVFRVEGGKVKLAKGELPLEKGGRVFFDCDGAMSFPIAWLNGRFVGGWANGYMPWRVDLTDALKDGENVLTIRTYRPADYARWHTGVGLTRRCWMTSVPEDYVVRDSISITTPVVTRARATVKVAYEMAKGGKKEKTFEVENPRLWDVDDPYLYTIDVEGVPCRYGIRSIEWTVDDGFHLNGRRVQIKGFCFHQELCSLGSVANRPAIRRRLEKAKALGMNALRMSHYPHATDWYELCDEMGILVMDELTDAWGLGKLANDYHLLFADWHERDLRTLIRLHRNHPSVVIWSLGNEIWESRSGAKNVPLYQKNGMELVRIAHQEDTTRPTVTANDNATVWRSPLAQFTDVWGFNYRPGDYAGYRALWPGRPVVATETVCTQTSRGEYWFDFVGKPDGKFGIPDAGRTYVNYHSSSYGHHTIAAADYEWAQQDANPFVAGSFSWTAFDYFGSPVVMVSRTRKPDYSDPARQAQAMAERTRYGRVLGGVHSCATGAFDLAGFAKDEAFLYQSRWRPDVPVAHILPHWNWPADRVGKVTPVYVYSSGDEVELFVNGVSQGRRGREKGLWRFRFNDVVYQPGDVRAVAYRGGKKWAEETVKTAGAPARLVATPERATIASDGEDVGYVTLKVVDKDGNFCPTASVPVTVTVSGAGRFYAAENGDETDFTWLRDPSRRTFAGLLSALVVATPGASGDIAVTFAAEGLSPVTAHISCK
jgi:beta-galactosidase